MSVVQIIARQKNKPNVFCPKMPIFAEKHQFFSQKLPIFAKKCPFLSATKEDGWSTTKESNWSAAKEDSRSAAKEDSWSATKKMTGLQHRKIGLAVCVKIIRGFQSF